MTVAVERPTGSVVPVSGAGATGRPVSWPGKKPPQTCMYPGEICSSMAGIDSARATGLACGNAARMAGSPRKWSACGWVMYTYSGTTSWDLTHAASSRPSRSVMRQSISTAPPSPLIRVEVDGGHVAWPTACSKPDTALGIGLGSTVNTSNSRLMAPPDDMTSADEYPHVDSTRPVPLRLPAPSWVKLVHPAGQQGTDVAGRALAGGGGWGGGVV